ncbi:MAG: hypothetical protein WCG25_03845 [bacterium]
MCTTCHTIFALFGFGLGLTARLEVFSSQAREVCIHHQIPPNFAVHNLPFEL